MQPKIIEIIGPPGIGKSTIYQSLCKTWKPRSQWIYPDVLVTRKPGIFTFSNWFTYHLRLLMGKKLTKSIPVDYGMRFAAQQQKLAKFCWNYLSDIQFSNDEDINKRFRSAFFLFQTFCIYQAIIEKAPAQPCILQEGFLQKSFVIREDDDLLNNELLNSYLLLIPLPYAIIYIDTPDIKEIVKRLRSRDKVIASHFGKDDDALRKDIERWLYTQNNILEKLKDAGVLIIKINGKRSVKENVSTIKKLLKQISDDKDAGPVDYRFKSTPGLLNAMKIFCS